ncbi:hypothetical protein A3C98_04065 [Candidatus Roizmanbacteria bacterium RIFCSPHIGHO2_02_FULL_37_15]|uniref:Transketolase N-terminal domain-containing protein n=1 Tax=Candidatus Roizmanbacteria bacterium RIFCSPLOWO2_01_FULL_37_16 TaxID=1802058 RepID=A0A1F7IMI0_9BACT|nr:MAG: hypothetical protein A2859_04195 [Candidatus Roizmanbacteria bacterium RIFCSPHIGHO2_01_FULL_37_16b]OGK22498.1 MAG: hypothetical protein A3C98_04065 [Candidatus Roizmanbacteria bacterium RIFCSPHIGHO2_02_FULL_37_15]OGK33556.1 MAG: hypothetical protein A3F57_05640 [Candidatus Roizmanbacteria bacterium RIFCSPHIGHO2_12_FULL_36_11]OGK44574.1 MAG: hypothetical protein A3B40_05315 [Candidatus Roizmanbacteria bacterium RIFCSPLOWO2_01_FULL_37_16]
MSVKAKNQLRIDLREKIIKLASKTPTAHPHIGSCMSCIDILIQTLIYEMKPQDKFILSKGHASLALYVVLNYLKKISNKDLDTYFSEGTEFGIHTPSTRPNDIPVATGSLGHGLSFAVGIAKAFKFLKATNSTYAVVSGALRRVYCLMSDGECNEGAVWEAAQFASSHKLSNLTALIDRNRLQAFGKTKDVLGDAASVSKWKAFGFNVIVCDGHNLSQIEGAFSRMKKIKSSKPNMIICNTIRGKGIRAIEGKVESNYTAMVGESYKQALEDIKRL